MASSQIDLATIANFPFAVAPHVGSIEAPTKDGMRFIASADGVMREVSTQWMLRTKMVAPGALPYGKLAPSVDFLVEPPPRHLWYQFVEEAQKVLPLETAALIVWNTTTRDWRLVKREVVFASLGRVDYREPDLADDELAIVDIHSHGLFGPFFSGRDNRDDSGCIKIAAVVGHLDLPQPKFAMRLVCIDEFLPIAIEDGKFTQQFPKYETQSFQ